MGNNFTGIEKGLNLQPVTLPVTGKYGDIVLDAADNTLKQWDGTSWIPVGSTPQKIVSGIDGDLVIGAGQVYNIAPGSVKQYNTITIAAGGILQIATPAGFGGTLNSGIGTTLQKTEIGCRNAFVNNGAIYSRYDGPGGQNIAGNTTLGGIPYNVTTPAQSLGGNGGSGADANGDPAWQVGLGTGGFGGGGSGGSGLYFDAWSGGGGGSNNGNGGQANGGPGGGEGIGNVTNGNGSAGGNGGNLDSGAGGNGGGSGGGEGGYGSFDGVSSYRGGGGGGGGGGDKGRHGGFLFLWLEGTISGSGTISCAGTNGFDGGPGGNGYSGLTWTGGGGGGGGGGAGGNGGNILLYKQATSLGSITLTASAGSGGSGGSGGTGANLFHGPSTAGSSGTAGTVGSTSVQDIFISRQSWTTRVITGTYTAVDQDELFANSTGGAFTITLPQYPTTGNRVRISDYAGTWSTNNVTVGRNGNNIDGAAADFTLNVDNKTVEFVYVDVTQGWKALT